MRIAKLWVSLVVIVVIAACSTKKSHQLTVGSKNFTESIILAELLAQQIEATSNCVVTRKFNLGGTFICHQALVAGQIDGEAHTVVEKCTEKLS